MNLTPHEIVAYLDEYIIGQKKAKKSIAIALRNRYRRMQLPLTIQEEVTPKNILMIGSTGVGKTEIARRLAKLMKIPFVKVEASKYTEVGFVGRDVESMVRDLVFVSFDLVKEEYKEKNHEDIVNKVDEYIISKLLPPLPKGVASEKKDDYLNSYKKMKDRLDSGDIDELSIEIKINTNNIDNTDNNLPPEMLKVQESFAKILNASQPPVKKEVKIKDAKKILYADFSEKLIDIDKIKLEALDRAQNSGIIFIDEIDKVAVPSNTSSRMDPSKEGVQRDLLPIVEGSTVNTKFGSIKTDHILFIAAGAFHVSKPSDLIPELQGRFPIRVELESLNEDTLYSILTIPKHSILKQYQELLKTEGVELIFENEAIRSIANFAFIANEKTEDIGARRLHTIVEKVIEDISYDAHLYTNKKYKIDSKYIENKLEKIVESNDLTRYIL